MNPYLTTKWIKPNRHHCPLLKQLVFRHVIWTRFVLKSKNQMQLLDDVLPTALTTVPVLVCTIQPLTLCHHCNLSFIVLEIIVYKVLTLQVCLHLGWSSGGNEKGCSFPFEINTHYVWIWKALSTARGGLISYTCACPQITFQITCWVDASFG